MKIFIKNFSISLLLTFSIYSYGRELRIISLSPNLTEIIFLLKKESTIVGRSSVCCNPRAALKIPVVGNLGDPDLEKVILSNPDIVLLTMLKDWSKICILQNLGIEVYIFPCNRISQYLETVTRLGNILRADKEAKQEIRRIRTYLSKIEKANLAIPDSRKPKIFWAVWDSPIITVGKNSFINEYISLAGGKNITSNTNRPYFYTSIESIMSANPEVIIAPCMKSSKINELKTLIGWQSIQAVKNNRVYGYLDPNLVYILGPRMLDAISAINDCLFIDK